IDGVNQTPVTLSAGVATLATSALPIGPHTITAKYSGAAGQFNSSVSSNLTQDVNAIGTAITLGSSGTPSFITQSVTFTATMTPLFGPGPVTGTVTFFDGANNLGSATLSSGVATLQTAGLAVGSHKITVTYAAQGNFAGNSSGAFTQVVDKVGT